MILLLSIGSLHAANTNDTADYLQDDGNDAVNNTIDPVTPSDNQSANSSNNTKSDYKTYTDLANEIENTKENSVLTISGSYKYDPIQDKKYQKGIVISKNIKIVGKTCSIDGNGQARCFNIQSNYKVTLDSLIIKNCQSNERNGGAILLNTKSHLIIKNCEFNNNKAIKANGGAIYCGVKTKLEIYNSKFTYNQATRDSAKKWPNDKRGMGGAIFMNVASNMKLYNSVFKKNTAYLSIIVVLSHTSNDGIRTSTVNVNKCLFERNTANINGVFYLDEYGKGKFLKSIFKKNKSKDKGGTLILDASKSVLVKNCRFQQNTGIYGGAIDLFRYNKKISYVTIVGCTFIKNKAEKAGGAIFCDFGNVKISKSKFVQNKAGVSGGAVEVRKAKLKLSKTYFNRNTAKCGGAVLVKDKKILYSYKCKFIKNKASVKGKNILGIFNHEVFKLKIKH